LRRIKVRPGFYLHRADHVKQQTYILAIAYHCMAGAGGFQWFFPTLTATLGYNDTVSLLLVAPPYVFMVFWSLGHGMVSDRLRHRFWFFMYPIPIVIAGCLIFMFTTSFGPRYFSFFLLNFVFTMNGTVSRINVPGRYEPS
jgi:hypothetical protein